ncbi:HAAS signaling domain-containing protein [Paenibacillus sp. IHBB 10380]|uniref:HAAS signaling domain-containing protein n=1 Tax=Paenibacillus sp. IHBB 10380 TaxID=1566358 RepID=UPI0005CFD30E|nr:DUF1700 domain-containing protein [Paenibacillus sp. IHBB 10380]AJS59068.1 hypothetical protein UB51_12050 [Paenibacillus sp. IHBB 10380]
MNKHQFLSTLHHHLASLAPEERNELMADYESHFIHGLQNGKTEAQIAIELGDPIELSKEMVDDRATIVIHTAKPSSIIRSLFVYVGLFFANIVVVPFFIALWAGWIGICAGALGLLLSPLLISVEYVINHVFFVSKLFASIAMMGIGIWLFIAAKFIKAGLLSITKSYGHWNTTIAKGGNAE